MVTPVSQPAEVEGGSFFGRNRKVLLLVGGVIVLGLGSRACTQGSRETQQLSRIQHIETSAAQAQADKDAQIRQLQSELEQGKTKAKEQEQADKKDQEAAASLNQGTLTAAQRNQLAAAGDASTTGANGVQQTRVHSTNQGEGVRPSDVPTRPASVFISYRGTEGVSDKPVTVSETEKRSTSLPTPAQYLADQRREQPEPNGERPSEAAPSIESAKANPDDAKHVLASAEGPTYRLRAGTLLPCTQQLRINGAFPGNVNCLVSIPQYSTDGQHLLIPQNTLALGRVTKVGAQNQERLYVTFSSFIMPDGYTWQMKDSDALDQIGQTGLRDKVNHHYPQIFGAAVVIASISGLAQIGNYGNTTVNSGSQYRSGITQGLSESALRVLERFSNVLPTFLIREGARNNIYLTWNLWLPDYARHTMGPEY